MIKQFLIIILLTIISISSTSAKTDTIVCSKYEILNISTGGNRIESFMFYDKNKMKIYCHGYYKSSRMDSIWTYYYKSGKIISVVLYRDKKIISMLNYDENGKIIFDSIFKNGTGTLLNRIDNGVITETYQYKNGLADGEHKVFSKYGGLLYTDEYKNDILNGLRQSSTGRYDEFYEDGKLLWTKWYYKNTNKTKVQFYTVYENGKMAKVIEYKKDGTVKKEVNIGLK